MRKSFFIQAWGVFISIVVLFTFVGCNYRPLKKFAPTQAAAPRVEETSSPVEIQTPDAARASLTICMGEEPESLFIYADSSQAAQTIRQAIYDGPIDILDYEPVPVILEEIPGLTAGGLTFEPTTVQPGEVLVDSHGRVISLSEGVSFFPSGCFDQACSISYTGNDPIQVDQQIVHFKLRSGLTWSDGVLLTADDSQFSYELAKSLFPRVRADLITRTQTYLALDDTTVEWRGLPGYRTSSYTAAFFTPLPRHAWDGQSADEMLHAEHVGRKPLGWGAYQIVEWTSGAQITMSQNPHYFRASEGIPAFDTLVFRFIKEPEKAAEMLLAGECDLLDETLPLADVEGSLRDAHHKGNLVFIEAPGSAWEHLDFGIATRSEVLPPIFQLKETRQALALCLDREKIIAEFFPGNQPVMDSYLPADHPLFNPNVRRYPFDPNAANALLNSIGWLDDDANPATPRRSNGLMGIPDGTPLEIPLLTSDDPLPQRIAELVSESLVQCGIHIAVNALPKEQLFAAGPDAPLFGRNFLLTQFGWMNSWQSPCTLFSTQEIPGPFPEFPQGWGGANLSGFSSPDFDRACMRTVSAMPDQPENAAAHHLAQAIFTEELPALPLFMHLRQIAASIDLCGLDLNPSADSVLWNIESFTIGEGCAP